VNQRGKPGREGVDGGKQRIFHENEGRDKKREPLRASRGKGQIRRDI